MCGLHGRVRNVVSQKLTFLIFFAFITSVLFSYFLPAGPLRMSAVGFPGGFFSTAPREERARSPRCVALWVRHRRRGGPLDGASSRWCFLSTPAGLIFSPPARSSRRRLVRLFTGWFFSPPAGSSRHRLDLLATGWFFLLLATGWFFVLLATGCFFSPLRVAA